MNIFLSLLRFVKFISAIEFISLRNVLIFIQRLILLIVTFYSSTIEDDWFFFISCLVLWFVQILRSIICFPLWTSLHKTIWCNRYLLHCSKSPLSDISVISNFIFQLFQIAIFETLKITVVDLLVRIFNTSIVEKPKFTSLWDVKIQLSLADLVTRNSMVNCTWIWYWWIF